MRKFIYIIVMSVCFMAMVLSHANGAGPEEWKEISAPEVKSMIESEDALVIHVLSEIEYNMQHITGSINIPIIKVAKSDKLPKDKNTPLIFYCMGKR